MEKKCLGNIHSEGRHNLYFSLDAVEDDQIKEYEMERMNKFRNLYKILIGKPDEKRPREVHRCRAEDIIKMYPKEK
jgi:hypothetical protein